MRKIINVIINEYIKIFAKISTKIMLVCIVLLAIFWNAGSYIASRNLKSQINNYDKLIEDNSDRNDTRAEMFRFMKDCRVTGEDDWRYHAIMDITERLNHIVGQPQVSDETKEVEKLWYERYKKAIADNDPKAFIQAQTEHTKSDKTLTDDKREIQLWSLQYQLDHNILPVANDKRYQTFLGLVNQKTKLKQLEQAQPEYQDIAIIRNLQNDIAIGEYVLDNNIKSYMIPDSGESSFVPDGFLSVFSNSTMLIMIINVLIIIVAGSMISMEFSTGTIKFLLINPIKRWKILLAKYLSVLTVGIVMLFIFYVVNLLICGIFFGFADVGAPILTVAGGKVHSGSSLLYIAWKYILGSLGVLTMATFAFAVSSLVRNSSLAIGLGVFLLLSGYGAVFILASGLKMDWARYILFANTDINLIINHKTPFIGQTVSFALIVTGVYMIIFLLTAWDAFVRRDIK